MLILHDASLAEHLTFNQFASGLVVCKLLIFLGTLFGSLKSYRLVSAGFGGTRVQPEPTCELSEQKGQSPSTKSIN